jgi:hypothetical protein
VKDIRVFSGGFSHVKVRDYGDGERIGISEHVCHLGDILKG